MKTLLLASAALVAAAGAAGAQQVTLRMSQFTPVTHFYHQKILTPWLAEVEKATGGRVKVEVTTAPLGPFPRNFDMAKDGVADVTAGNHGVTPGRFALTQIVETPFIKVKGQGPEAASVALWRTHEKFLAPANEHAGTVVLTLHTSGSAHFFTLGKPINSVEDFKGVKIIANGDTAVKVAERLGMVPIVKPVTEYYDTVSKGVVDGLIGTSTAIKGWRVGNFVKHQLSFPGGMLYGTFFLVVNERKWATVGEADRKAILAVTGESYARRAGKVFEDEDAAAHNEFKATINSKTMSDPKMIEHAQKALSFIDEDYVKRAEAKKIDGKAAIAFFRAEAEKYEPTK